MAWGQAQGSCCAWKSSAFFALLGLAPHNPAPHPSCSSAPRPPPLEAGGLKCTCRCACAYLCHAPRECGWPFPGAPWGRKTPAPSSTSAGPRCSVLSLLTPASLSLSLSLSHPPFTRTQCRNRLGRPVDGGCATARRRASVRARESDREREAATRPSRSLEKQKKMLVSSLLCGVRTWPRGWPGAQWCARLPDVWWCSCCGVRGRAPCAPAGPCMARHAPPPPRCVNGTWRAVSAPPLPHPKLPHSHIHQAPPSPPGGTPEQPAGGPAPGGGMNAEV